MPSSKESSTYETSYALSPIHHTCMPGNECENASFLYNFFHTHICGTGILATTLHHTDIANNLPHA
jgi:hypothetical protein